MDDARAAFAEAREGLLAAGLQHETVDVDAGWPTAQPSRVTSRRR